MIHSFSAYPMSRPVRFGLNPDEPGPYQAPATAPSIVARPVYDNTLQPVSPFGELLARHRKKLATLIAGLILVPLDQHGASINDREEAFQDRVGTVVKVINHETGEMEDLAEKITKDNQNIAEAKGSKWKRDRLPDYQQDLSEHTAALNSHEQLRTQAALQYIRVFGETADNQAILTEINKYQQDDKLLNKDQKAALKRELDAVTKFGSLDNSWEDMKSSLERLGQALGLKSNEVQEVLKKIDSQIHGDNTIDSIGKGVNTLRWALLGILALLVATVAFVIIRGGDKVGVMIHGPKK